MVDSPQSLEEKPVQESSTDGGVGYTVQEMNTCNDWDTSPELMENSTAGGLAHTVQEESTDVSCGVFFTDDGNKYCCDKQH